MIGKRIGMMAAAAGLFAGCMTLEPGQKLNLMSSAEEVQLGAELAAEVERQERVLADPALQAYLNEVGQRLAAVAERQDVRYQFKVIDAPDTVNAFALPGGFMYVYTGLMRLCENEAELASVMAHEIAHVAAYHHGEAMTRQYGYQLLSSLILGRNPGQAAQIVSGFIGSTGSNYFSRQDETEADAKGMEYLFRAGYHPDAMTAFMKKMGADDPAGVRPRAMLLFSSHPATADRVARLSSQAAAYPPDLRARSVVNAERYREQVLARLGR